MEKSPSHSFCANVLAQHAPVCVVSSRMAEADTARLFALMDVAINDGLQTTFASHYAKEVSLAQALQRWSHALATTGDLPPAGDSPAPLPEVSRRK